MSKKDYIDVEGQWEKWLAENPTSSFKHIDEQELREKTIKDLSFVSQMDVKEYTLYQKWCEIHEKYPTETKFDLVECREVPRLIQADQDQQIRETKAKIWMPNDPDDYLGLSPILEYTDDSGTYYTKGLDGKKVKRDIKRTKDLPEKWNTIRTFSSTMKNNSNIGRNLNFVVKDKNTDQYLGVICISSDFLDLTPRDNFIGWSRERKTQGRGINFTAIGSTIVPLQPLGYNYVGGKLLALLCLSDTVQDVWKSEYGDVLAAVTTTSLYGNTKAGGMSQYDGLEHWQKMGFTSGSVSYEPERDTRYMIREWIKENYPRKYFEWYVAVKESGQPHKRDHKNRSLTFVYNKLKIPKNLIRSEHQRGIYFSPLYDNSCAFLRGEIKEKELIKSFDTSTESLVETWRKHAKGRISQLKKRNQVSKETLFYDDLIYLNWEETKAKYLPQVGR